MLEGAVIALAAFLLGRLLPGRRRKPLAAGKPPKPVCGCCHHHAHHDPQTGQCRATVDGKPIHFDKWGDADAWAQVPCTCQRYSGPVPLPEMFAPEIGS